MKFLSCIISALLLFVALCAKAETPFSDPTKPIYLNQSTTQVVLKLKSNPTTGYAWFLKSIHGRWLNVVSHHYVAPSTRLVGAPGYELWTFSVNPKMQKMPFSTEIVMIYARPWEKTESTQTTFKIFYRPTERSAP